MNNLHAIEKFPKDLKDVIVKSLADNNITHLWPSSIADELEKIKNTPIDFKNRKDLTHLPFVTIDNNNTKDFDDALYCERTNFGWKLFVSIADVSYYVRPNSQLDKEAARPGNSFYFANLVVPMFPDLLSQDLCSLVPNKNRLCLTSEIDISTDGKIIRYRFFSSVIKSRAKLTYDEVKSLLTSGSSSSSSANNYSSFLGLLYTLYDMSLVLRKKRFESLDNVTINSHEHQFALDEFGNIKALEQNQSNEAHILVEEAMILANICAVLFISKYTEKMIYRIEKEPLSEKLQEFNRMISSLNFGPIKNKDDIANFLRKIAATDYQNALEQLLIRTMTKAVFSVDRERHYLLNLDQYTYFISPIRRYVDIVTHRLIKYCLTEFKTPKEGINNTSNEFYKTSSNNAVQADPKLSTQGLVRNEHTGMFDSIVTRFKNIWRADAAHSVIQNEELTEQKNRNTQNSQNQSCNKNTISPQDIGGFLYNQTDLRKIAEHCTETELNAQKAYRSIHKFLECKYLSTRINQEFTGTIISVANFGFFVMLDNICLDAFVYIGSLGVERFNFNSYDYTIRGNYKKYYVGQRLKLKLRSVTMHDCRSKFEVIAEI